MQPSRFPNVQKAVVVRVLDLEASYDGAPLSAILIVARGHQSRKGRRSRGKSDVESGIIPTRALSANEGVRADSRSIHRDNRGKSGLAVGNDISHFRARAGGGLIKPA